MSRTKTEIQTEKSVSSIGNGAKLVFDGIEEYDALPKCDRREYVIRVLGLYQLALQGAREREEMVNSAHRKIENANTNIRVANGDIQNLKTELAELKRFEKTVWYRLYKWFNR